MGLAVRKTNFVDGNNKGADQPVHAGLHIHTVLSAPLLFVYWKV